MPMYSNIGGGSKTLTSLYGNVGGSQKAISYLYSNITNAQKEIYPNNQLYADGTIYVWDKFNATSSSEYTLNARTIASITNCYRNPYAFRALAYSFDSSNGAIHFTTSPQTAMGNYRLAEVDSDDEIKLTGSGQYLHLSAIDWVVGSLTIEDLKTIYLPADSSYVFCYVSAIDTVLAKPYKAANVSGDIIEYTAKLTTTYAKGSTSYGEVTSTKSNAYPQDGYSNGYWYVYKGTTTGLITYTQISGIKVSGNARIDTGIKADNNTRMVMDFNIPSLTAQQALCGARNSGGSGGFAIFTYNGNAGFQVDFSSYQQYPVPATGTYTGRHTLDLNKNKFYLDGSLVHTFTNTAFTGSYNIFIGSINNGGLAMTAYPADGLIIYPCKIYTNGSLVRDYVPAKTPDGLVGLFDKVDRALYTNAGTGSFIGIE